MTDDKFTELDRQVTEHFYETGNYGPGYQNLSNQFEAGSGRSVWFQNAAFINSGYGPGSVFARVQTHLAYEISALPQVDPQIISDDIADAVLGHVSNKKGGIGTSVTLDQLHAKEAYVVVEMHGLPKHLWTFSSPITGFLLGTGTKFVTAETNTEIAELAVTNVLAAGSAFVMAIFEPMTADEKSAELNAEIADVSRNIVERTKYGISADSQDADDLDGDGYVDSMERLASLQKDAFVSPQSVGPSTSFPGDTRVIDTPSGPQRVWTGSRYDYGDSDDDDHPTSTVGPRDQDDDDDDVGPSSGGPHGQDDHTSTTGGSLTGSTGTGSGRGTGTNSGGADSGQAAEREDNPNQGTYDHYSRGGGAIGGLPILLDLDGNGIKVTDLSRSTVFMVGDDGLEHRTAWAGRGDGVLFYDVGNDGKIEETREYVFTEWDPTARSDFEALRARFDSNNDGKLTSADAAFSIFKVMVTNADGSQTAQTLAQLGITSIDLTGDTTDIRLPDGSVITGQSTFTIGGVQRTAADVTLMGQAQGLDISLIDNCRARIIQSMGNCSYAKVDK